MKNNTTIKKNDIYSLPKKGKQIIEISSGKEKNSIIKLIYLNLLLGIQNKKSTNKQLTVKEILLISFNSIEIEKIKILIQKSIHKMRISCLRNGIGFQKNSIYKKLLNYITDKNKINKKLLQDENQINEVQIYTIQEFCKKIAKKNSFSLNLSFNYSIIKNEIKIQREACYDFWRKNCYTVNQSTLKSILKEWNHPEKLFCEIKPYLTKKIPNFLTKKYKTENIQNKHKKIINEIQKIKNLWNIYHIKIYNLILKLKINKHIYNKKNLKNWTKKINKWTKKSTTNYNIPKELKYFSQSNLKKQIKKKFFPKYKFFLKIENFFKKSFTLRNIILYKVITYIKKTTQEKKNNEKISNYDLFKIIQKKINNEKDKKLNNLLKNQYSAIIIDEFQDANSEQLQIFQKIYEKKKNYLIYIGDPKQSIYNSFKSDISNYFKIRKTIKSYYKIDIDSQSSFDMTSAINQLFSNKKNPFLFKKIQFNSFQKIENTKNFMFFYKNKKVKAINLYIIKNKNTNKKKQKKIADTCAKTIFNWINGGKKKNTWIFQKNKKKFLKQSDITILIRNENEALKIKKSLKKYNIQSKFSKYKKNVFSTNEALDLLFLLKAILQPYKEGLIQTALSTNLMQLSAKKIESIKKKKLEYEINKFHQYNLTWNKHGIFETLNNLFYKHKIIKKLIKQNEKETIINIIHISELLQKAESKNKNKNQLILWFSKQIENSKNFSETKKTQETNEKNSIQINTIYQSKGKKYPIVWIPFENRILKKNFFNKNITSKITKYNTNNFQEKKNLLKDLCSFYIAVTRSQSHCSIGVSYFENTNKIKKNNYMQSTILHLLNNKKNKKETKNKNIKSLSSKYIKIIFIKKNNKNLPKIKKNQIIIKKEKKFTNQIQKNWKIANYSYLIKNTTNYLFNKSKKKIKKNNLLLKNEFYEKKTKIIQKKKNYDIHQFPTGTKSGIFFHYILKSISFKEKPNTKWITNTLKKFEFSTKWTQTIKKLLKNISNTPLTNKKIKLSHIKHKIKEMKFYIPIKKTLYPHKLEKILLKNKELSKKIPKINFKPFKGILNGSIDLIIYWKKKIYFIDYKSNWLGENILNYDLKSLKNHIIHNRYDLQYQLYTLAIHRYLKKKINNYNYKKNFGGVIYLFLRGCDIKYPKYGSYYTNPSYLLINDLDKLF